MALDPIAGPFAGGGTNSASVMSLGLGTDPRQKVDDETKRRKRLQKSLGDNSSQASAPLGQASVFSILGMSQ